MIRKSMHPNRSAIVAGGSLILTATAFDRTDATTVIKSTDAVPAFIANLSRHWVLGAEIGPSSRPRPEGTGAPDVTGKTLVGVTSCPYFPV